MEELVSLFFSCGMLLIPAAIIGGVFYFGYTQNKKNKARWQAIAEQLGLEYLDGGSWALGEIQGSYGGNTVRIWTFTRGGGKNKTTYTAIGTSLPMQLNMGLNVTREGIFTGIGKMLGQQDIQIGDQEFDRTFLIKGHDPERVIALLNPELRGTLLQYNKHVGALNLSDEQIYWERTSVISDAALIKRVLDAQSAIATLTHQAWVGAVSDVAQPAFWEVNA